MDVQKDKGQCSYANYVNNENSMVLLPEYDENYNESDVEVFELDPEFHPTPRGTPYWIPDVPIDEKPKKHDFFDTFDDAYHMYKAYAEKARFNIRKCGITYKKGLITYRNIECNRAGNPRKTKEVNTLIDSVEQVEDNTDKRKKRWTTSQACKCPARIGLKRISGTETYKVYEFVEYHNHKLINVNNMDLSKSRRQLQFDDYVFIHRASMTSIGPSVAHRIKVALVGGYDNMRGTTTQYRNYRTKVNSFIRDRDAQMLVDKMLKRKKHVPEFSFEYHTLPSKELVRLFWADETMKCNYVAFGDVVSFDATFHTNKYGYKFVPFTGIDHNQKSVTFAVALISNETFETFKWMLEAFLRTHKKQPPFALTDQDGALRNAVLKVFLDSQHRLCMWHITEKLPAKVLGDLDSNTNFRKDFNKLVWNVYISRERFEQRWDDLIARYNLHDNKWLSDMYQIRDRWIPGYFSDVPMCGLMKTTSRSESSNSFFQIYSHPGNTLVQFMLCFESAMEKQRYNRRVIDNASDGTTPSMFTDLPIEKHACELYTPSIFREVQHEIYKALTACSQTSSNSEGSIETCIIRHRDKRQNTIIFATVVFDQTNGSVTCSCGHYNRHGYLCRHVFNVFQIYGVDKIPDMYINRRWTKDVLPSHLLDKRHRYGPCIEETDRLASRIHATIEDCISLIRNDSEKLSDLLGMAKDLKKKLEDEMPQQNVDANKEDLIAQLLEVTVPDKLEILNPQSVFASKGTRRIKSSAEKGKEKSVAKAKRTNRKRPYKKRICGLCGREGHYRSTCPDRFDIAETSQAGSKRRKINKKAASKVSEGADEGDDNATVSEVGADDQDLVVEASECDDRDTENRTEPDDENDSDY